MHGLVNPTQPFLIPQDPQVLSIKPLVFCSGMQENVDAFITKVKQDYYVAGVNSGDLSERYFKSDGQGGWTPVAGWENVIFASPPGSGGAILKL